MIVRLICLCVGYVCGLFQTGYIVGKIKGIDIREYGSGNAGTTNILRTMGLKYALIVLLGDALKCGLAILVVRLIFGSGYAGICELLYLYASFGVILGHNFPFYMGFKGGKGIAATAGFILFGLSPVMTLAGLVVFFSVFFITHYVSLGSIMLYVALVVCSFVFMKTDFYEWSASGSGTLYIEYSTVIIIMMILMLIRHKDNIKRLIAGNERKTYLRSRPEIDVR
ncbi:MAG: glycerol-3-phosphate 1-O-acyltransferase PlsY [Lachnospiraceae bacterium]|nr:glycerol-3-phosphate 1-O-acyltransferase PlsY [Lachnospiraceae bacterium]